MITRNSISLFEGTFLGNNNMNVRGPLTLLQQAVNFCDPMLYSCAAEKTMVLVFMVGLSSAIVGVFCLFFFFREDKEEQVTPLCPQLVVKDTGLSFRMNLSSEESEKIEILNNSDPTQVISKVVLDWPDPFRPGASGIAATARLQSSFGINIATVVARNAAVQGQGLALCRSGAEIFGFVEPDTSMRYHVRHRTGVHLLTLVGDFSNFDIEGVNPVGTRVFSSKQVDGACVGKVSPHFDAGLILCCMLAAHIHRILLAQPASLIAQSPATSFTATPGASFATPAPLAAGAAQGAAFPTTGGQDLTGARDPFTRPIEEDSPEDTNQAAGMLPRAAA
mmetsp:Transcript_98048/g.169920  ORF Transcript_98048/g.169920 Transcript_98048/m.169920 type:complete len:335 (+) Transcript_98048:67-1071(+)